MLSGVVTPSVFVLAITLAGTAVHRRLPARTAARLIAGLTVAVMFAVVPTLLLVSIATLVHTPVLQPLWWCTHSLHGHAGLSGWSGAIATVLVAVGSVRVVRLVATRRRLMRCCATEACVDVVEPPDRRVHLTADEAPYAVTLPGTPPKIVVSSGLLAALHPAETHVVLAHERAHARNRHDRYLLVGEILAAVLPPAKWLASRLQFSLERWADDEAAESCGDRAFVARTIGKVALVAAPVPGAAGAAGVAGVAGVAGSAGVSTVARVRMLLEPEVRGPNRACRVLIGSTGVVVSALVFTQLHHLVPLVAVVCHS